MSKMKSSNPMPEVSTSFMWSTLSILLLLPALARSAPADLQFDSIIETNSGWRIQFPQRTTLSVTTNQTHNTPRALRTTWSKDLGDLGGRGIPSTPLFSAVWIRLPVDLDLSQYTALTFWAKLKGTRHGFLHLAVAERPNLWGRHKIHYNNVPLDAGEWRRHQLTLAQIPPEHRQTYRWFGIGSINVGRLPDEAKQMQVWLDDFVLTAKPQRKMRGWDADPEVIIVNQAGFRRFHEKHAVIHSGHPDEAFVIRDSASGKEVFTGKLTSLRSTVGSYQIADFTPLTKAGRYRIESGQLKSLEFTIGDQAYDGAIELLSDWIFNMRCGCQTALHEACHLDDGTYVRYEGEGSNRREVSREHLDLAGGWHDAGDVRTYYFYTCWMAHQALRARANGWRRDRNNDGVDDLMDSAIWAMRHLPKIRNPDDGQLFFKIADRPNLRRGDYWTDGIRGNHDDRHSMAPELVRNVGRACASAGLFARVAGAKYPALSAAALQVAEERWAVWFDPDKGKKPWRRQSIDVHGHGFRVAAWGQGSLQLHLATRKPVYGEFARLCAERIMSYQQRAFYPGGPQPMCGEIFSWFTSMPERDLPEEFLADLVLELPDDADWRQWRAALVRAAHWWMKPTRQHWAPFSVPHLEFPASRIGNRKVAVPLQRSPDGQITRYLVPVAGNNQFSGTCKELQRVAQALNDIELERLVRRQVQWAIGHNPFNVSWICGYGEDCVDQFYSFAQGRMPGAVQDFGLNDSGVPSCVRPYGGEPTTRSGMRLLRAMISVTEPARLRLTVREGTKPWTGEIQIRWNETGETVHRTTSDEHGIVPPFELDGGQSYELRCGGIFVPLKIISGMDYERVVDLDREIVLSAAPRQPVQAGEAFTVDLRVRNLGNQPTTTTIRVHAEDASTKQIAQTIDLPPKKFRTIKWQFVAGEPNRPYILIFEPDGDRARCHDVTGAILPNPVEATK